ncbi:MAG: DNA alkylation repair protein [Bacillaceae bacterium]
MEIVSIYRNHKDEERAIRMAAYMKNHFSFLGIQKPIRAQLQKEWLKEQSKAKEINWGMVEELWDLPEREFQYLALDYLVKMKKYVQQADIDRLKILLVTKSWWDTVDALASHLVGEVCKLYPEVIQSHIKEWTVDDNMWLRRTAILFQLKYKEKTDIGLLTEIILQNNESKEFFINKAVGWALREYAKTNPDWVRSFIANHSLQPLSVREGSKRL